MLHAPAQPVAQYNFQLTNGLTLGYVRTAGSDLVLIRKIAVVVQVPSPQAVKCRLAAGGLCPQHRVTGGKAQSLELAAQACPPFAASNSGVDTHTHSCLF